jgi:hypothetical protein
MRMRKSGGCVSAQIVRKSGGLASKIRNFFVAKQNLEIFSAEIFARIWKIARNCCFQGHFIFEEP